MLIDVPEVLTAEDLAHLRQIFEHAPWADGRITAGTQSAQVKNNQQLPEACIEAEAARGIVLAALNRNALFFTAALPKTIFPPLFNRYTGAANAFGNHIDNAIRTIHATGQRVRTDVSCTLFLSDPDSYEGGELVIEDSFGPRAVKLPAGHMVVYPSSSVHRVAPVTRGERIASFFWLESLVREDHHRRMLFDMDLAILDLRQSIGETEAVVRLTGCYHNLLRHWSTT